MSSWPLTAVCAGWLVGTASHLQTVQLLSPAAYAAWCLGTVVVWWGWRHAVRTTHPLRSRGAHRAAVSWVITGTLSASLAMGLAGWRAATQWSQRLDPALEGLDLVLVGVVARLPDLQPDQVRFGFEVERAWRADSPGDEVRVPPLVVLVWSGDPGSDIAPGARPSIQVADRWRFPVRLKAPHASLNPHGPDLEVWLWSQGVMAVGQVRGSSPPAVQPVRLASTVAYPIERWRQACRDRLWRLGLEPRLAGIVSALLLGDQAAIDPLDWDVFRRTGVAHLMSISGLHITLLAAVMRRLLSGAWRMGGWRRRPLTLICPASTVGRWGGLGVACLYALFCGWGLPAQRTVLMLAVFVWQGGRGVVWPWWATWLLAGAVVLAWDPWAWLNAGFWLSFVAVGMLMGLDERSRHTDRAEHTNTRSQMVHAAQDFWREQWRITLGLAPLTLLLFREVSLLGWLANLVAIPWVTLVVTPLVLSGMLWPGAWHWAAEALSWLQQGLLWMLTWGVPPVSVAAFPGWVAVPAVLGAGMSCLSLPLGLRVWGVALWVPVLGWQAPMPPEGEVEVVVADVGQGQAVLVRTRGHVLLYDAGPRYSQDMDAGQRVVVPLLQAYDARLDRLVLSHRDADHTGGALAVLAMQPQADVLGSLPSRDALSRHPRYRDCEAGQSWVWDGVQFDVLHPIADAPTRGTSNAWSCVLRVRTAGSSLLLAGDIEASEEAALVSRLGAALQTDVLLVPHHGSRTSSSAVWLEAVQPRWAWVQAGYRNRYGHPAPEVMARYHAQGIPVLETARCGAILWSSAQPTQVQCEREARRRYWHHVPP